MSWTEIRVIAQDTIEAEAVAEVLQLFALENEWVAMEQLGDPDDVRADAMLSETTVKLVVEAERVIDAWRQEVATKLMDEKLPSAEFIPVPDTDWTTAWKENFKPLKIGDRFWIRPSWEEVNAASSDLIITIDPGNAFGTGTHETTQLCLALIEQYVQAGKSVLDLGCGSGILAIGAALLGAEPILAVDIDADSVAATRLNADVNSVSELIQIGQGSLDAVEDQNWDVLIANILAPTLIDMLANDQLLSYIAEDGVLILSGILGVQSAEMHVAIKSAGGVVSAEIKQGEWIAQIVRRQPPNVQEQKCQH